MSNHLINKVKHINWQYISKNTLLILIATGLILFTNNETLASSNAGGADAFASIWTTLKQWTQGTLGKVISIIMILVGIIGGVARQSLIAFAVGIGGGIGLYNTPTVIESVMGININTLLILN